MSHQYHRSFDPNAQDSLAKLARLVPAGSEVLDIGAGPGVLAHYLSEQCACYVDGIEYDRQSAMQGRGAFRSLWVADLNTTDVITLVGVARYDYILCADVLEHLVAPEQLLRQLSGLLKDGGHLLLSIPNVAHIGLLAELLGGELRYRPEGLLDHTHLRFFTRTSLQRLLETSGWQPLTFDCVHLPIEQSEFAPAVLDALPSEVVDFLRTNEDAETYQFIVDCVPSHAAISRTVPLLTASVAEVARVDVIVPVYAGLAETQACLDSLFNASVTTPYEIVVIDDVGPEPELRAWLRSLAASGQITLLENTKNLGYVASVNRGIELHPERDVVLLNSDAEVANDWLDRLRAAAYASADIGTVTPFANSGATICAYPQFCVDNPLPDGWDLTTLDALIRDINPGAGVDLPTSVGFCTYIRRACLDAVGLFDVATFGRGYGEENDFCMRAHYHGWRHRLAADVFVLHHGGISFGSDKAALVEQAVQAVCTRHPTYDGLVADHIRRDPARSWRERIDWCRLAYSPRRRLLLITHALGGGTERHVQDLARWLEDAAEVLVLRPAGEDCLTLSWQRRGEVAAITFQRTLDLKRLIALLHTFYIERAHIHHLIGLETEAQQILQALSIPYDLTLHDFFMLCPRITLFDDRSQFCDQPAEHECKRCLAADPELPTHDIRTWRQSWQQWLSGADRILVPSHDTAARIRRIWPKLHVRVAAHDQLPAPMHYPPVQARSWQADRPLRVVVVGHLPPAKGLMVLTACARDAAKRGLPLEFHHLGDSTWPLPSLAEAPVITHGAYVESELAARLHFLSPHLAWFPAVWPETWCYTLSGCLMAALPVVAPQLGAFPERLANRPGSYLLPNGLDAEAINDRLLAFGAELNTLAMLDRKTESTAISAQIDTDFIYSTEYLNITAPQMARPLIHNSALVKSLVIPLLIDTKQSAQHISALTQTSEAIISLRSWRSMRSLILTRLKPLWWRLPLSGQMRYRVKSLLFRIAPPLFRGTATYNAWLELNLEKDPSDRIDTSALPYFFHRVWLSITRTVSGTTENQYPPVQPRSWQADRPLRIVVIGPLSPANGLNVLASCARDAAKRALPLEFHYLGDFTWPLPSLAEAPLIVHGAYAESELTARLHLLSPHLAWFLAIKPKTWGHTLNQCRRAALPIVVPQIWSIPERLINCPDCYVLPHFLDAETINNRLLEIGAELNNL